VVFRWPQSINSTTGSQPLADYDPGLMSLLFPLLDPWGIRDFCDTRRRPDQYISFDQQVQNLLRQHDSPFQRDPNFSYVCWNIIQKQAVQRQATFWADVEVHSNISTELREVAPDLTNMVAKWQANPHATASNKQEKKAVRTMNKLKLIVKEVKGSCGYKQCRRNEICALMNRYSTPALFVTLNPSDVNNPLIVVMAGMDPEEWRKMYFRVRSILSFQSWTRRSVFRFFYERIH
jgi:hypothetical protein